MKFYKYQGTGNDFIMIDNRNLTFPKTSVPLIQTLCDRRFGIGGDGLILLESQSGVDFKMVYFNSDGNQSTMCGNGGRCLVAFAQRLNVISKIAVFEAIDGLHYATILENGAVSLQMKDVLEVKVAADYVFLDTGSPHHVTLVNELENLDVKSLGSQIRYSDLYKAEGSNVNFVDQISDSYFALRTYERGVEDETLSCGTGATATAIAMFKLNKTNSKNILIDVLGGNLKVSFDENKGVFTNVFLEGAAKFVFEGEVELPVDSD